MAKKRYYQSKKDRRDESRGMYESYEGRKNQEMKDGAMIKEDRSAIANLPQNVMIKKYPSYDYASDPMLNDKLSGIDKQMNEDVRAAKKHRSKSKY